MDQVVDGTIVGVEAAPPGWPRRVVGTAVVVAAAGSLVFEQSPANEMVRTNAALEVLESTGSAWRVGLTVAAITVVIEMISGALIAVGLHLEGGPVQRLKRRMVRDHEGDGDAPSPSGGRRAAGVGTDVAVALGLGAGLVTMRRHVADPAPTLRKDLKNTAVATAVVAGVSGLIGYLAGGGLANADRVGLGTPARYVVDYGTDTRFWVTLLVVGYGAVGIRALLRRRRERSGS